MALVVIRENHSMAVFPRLRDVFGVPVDQIDVAAIARAIARHAPESEQLDWKRDPYKKGEGDEIAKDIAGMANNVGGVIVLGVGQDVHSRADEDAPFADSVDVLTGMISEVRQRRIRPFVDDLTVTPIATDGGKHYVVIAVGRSFDAPHAVMPENRNAKHLAFPVRQMTTTGWLKESQVAALYRDRYAARADVASAADGLMRDHAYPRPEPHHWLSLAVAPTISGSRPPGPAARDAEVGFATGWTRSRAIPGSNFDLDLNMVTRQTRPAIGQTLVIFHDASVRLGHNGSAHIAQSIPSLNPNVVDMRTPLSNSGGRRCVWASTDEVEWALFVSLSYAVDHAIDTGATGDLEIRATLDVGTPATTEGGPSSNGPLGGLACFHPRAGYGAKHAVPEQSGLLTNTAIVAATLGISAGADRRAIGSAVYLLATDILAEFGIDEPRLFAPDGWVTVEQLSPELRQWDVSTWVTEHLNIDTPPT